MKYVFRSTPAVALFETVFFKIPVVSPPPDISPSVYKPIQNPLRCCISTGLKGGSFTALI